MTTDVTTTSVDQFDEDAFSVLDRLSRALHIKEAGLQPTLDAIVRAATEYVPGANYAGLNLLVGGKRFEPQAVFGAPPPVLDEQQKTSGEGPCIDASREQIVIHIEDMATDTRWPQFAALAVSLGVGSMLCLPLWVDDRQLGSLSLCSANIGFDAASERMATLLALHAALALSEAQRTEQLRVAIANRDLIGQAKGILMERHRITPDEAFSRLAAVSQRTNRRLADIADEVSSTGRLPE